MSSFSTPLSGLNASSQSLTVISNNLANLNTVGYKGQTAQFQDLFYQRVGTDGAGNPIQVGVGTRIGSVASRYGQGNLDSTGVSTDFAIQGDGFFMVQKQNGVAYTRAGNFTVDANGFLATSEGAKVLGYPANGGVVSTNQALAPLLIAGAKITPAKATGSVLASMNLNAGAATKSVFSAPVTAYDSLGGSHLVSFDFTKSGANAWDYSITVPAADVGKTGAAVEVGKGTLNFDGTGKLTTPAANVTGISISGLADGASDIQFDWQLYGTDGAAVISQVASPSAVSKTQQDGYAAGSVSEFSVGEDGVIQGILNNGQTLALGQLALAIFPNNQGLVRSGANEFVAGLAAGIPNPGAPGAGGRGTISGGALERSNVDIATEFAKLIQTERSYQANARAITAADELTQAAIALKSA